MKTVRFKSVVANSGKPEQYLPWMDPARDRTFMQAVRDDRVVTIQTHNVGTRKDTGIAGFHRGKASAYLVFPRPHELGPDSRIVGIDYDLIREPAGKGPRVKPKLKEKARPLLSKPALSKRFRIKLLATARREVELEVEADTAAKARQAAEEQLRHQDVRFPTESVAIKVQRTKSLD